MKTATRQCASDIFDAIPDVVQFIRREMRSHRLPGLSVPQFRLLAFLWRHHAATPSAAAEHLGLSMPGLSRMIRMLLRKKLITRKIQLHDRRRAVLQLTPQGQKSLAVARRITRSHMAQQLQSCSPAELAVLQDSMRLIRFAFGPGALQPEQKTSRPHRA